MDQGSAARSSGASTAVRRRTVLKSLGATGVAAAATSRPAAASASAPAYGTGWNAFASAIAAEFRRVDHVGAAAAVVSADRVLHRQPIGVRDLAGRRPVTNSTHFLVASTTKSMTSLLVATYVDAGKFGWDQPVVDVWPQFRAPTGELTVTGCRVVSAGNLAECWKPHIPVSISPEFDPDVVTSGYAMGWIRNTFRDGTSLVWHNGPIDGFTAFIGFLPERDIGLVVLNSMNPVPTGLYFYLYVLNTLLSQRFGLNSGVPAKVHEAYRSAVAAQRAMGERTRPVNAKAVAPYLGYYEGGYRVELVRGDLQVRLASRVLPVRATKDGGYVIGSGVLAQNPVRLFRDVDDTPRLDLVGVESVRRTVGLD